jgi:serine/threonine protein kinase/tetratricopeptide (TPR) repeat protein
MALHNNGPQMGSRIGEWTVGRRLGSGGMGVVFEVTDATGDLRALKLMNLLDEVSKRRFVREYRALRRLAHDNVVAVDAIGEHEGRPFFTMQLIEGVPLDVFVGAASGGGDLPTAEVGWPAFPDQNSVADEFPDDPFDSHAPAAAVEPLTDDEMVQINAPERLRRIDACLRQILAGLGYIHDQGIVHRDLKPSNLLVRPDGRVVVMDFGVAVDAEAEIEPVETGQLIGTFAYMSPEQLRGGEVDLRSDLYGLGVMLFEMLVGRRPFDADSPASAIYQHVFTAAPEVSVINPAAPRVLAQLTAGLLAKKPSARPASAWDVLQTLGEAVPPASGRPVHLFRPALVGRDRECQAIIDQMASAAQRLWVPPVMLSGPTGCGKTRLLHEVAEKGRGHGFRLVRLRGDEDRSEAYSYLAPIFDILFDAVFENPLIGRRILRSDGPVIARVDPRLAELEGFAIVPAEPLEAEAERRRAKAAIWRVIHRLARQEPLLLCADQLHDADELSFEVLQHVAHNIAETVSQRSDEWAPVPLVLVLAWRSEVDSIHPFGRLAAIEPQLTAALKPLDMGQVERLAFECVGSPVAEDLIDLLVRHAQGIPMLVRQMIRRLADQGILARNPAGEWSLADPAQAETLATEGEDPERGIDQMVSQALTQVVGNNRTVLEQAALLGREFAYEQLEQLCQRTQVFTGGGATGAGEKLLDSIDWLLRQKILRDLSERKGWYRFVHDRFRIVVLDVLDSSTAASGHFEISELLGAMTLDASSDQVLHHALLGANDKLALRLLPDAAERARQVGDLARALTHYDRLIALSVQMGLLPPAVAVFGRSGILRDQGDVPGAMRTLAEAKEDERWSPADVLLLKAGYLEAIADEGMGSEALALMHELGSHLGELEPELALRIQRARIAASMRYGEPHTTKAMAEDALRRMGELGVRHGRARLLQVCAISEERTGDLRESLRLFAEAEESARAADDQNSLLITLVNRTSAEILAGKLRQALATTRQAIDLAKRLEHHRALAVAEANALWALLEIEPAEDLVEEHLRNLETLERSGNRFAVPECHLHLARILVALGRPDAALEHAERGRDVAQAYQMRRERVALDALIAGLTADCEVFEVLRAEAEAHHMIDQMLWCFEQEGLAFGKLGATDQAAEVWKMGLRMASERGYELFANRFRAYLKGETGA